jgi:hypothetical protein
MVEPHRQQPLSGHVLDTAVAAAGPQVSVQVGDRLGQPGMVGGQHRPARRRVAQAVQDGNALGGAQDDVKGRHRPLAVRAAEELPGVRAAALEHALEPGHRCFAIQPKPSGGGAVPAAWGLPVAGQIRLVVGG